MNREPEGERESLTHGDECVYMEITAYKPKSLKAA